MGGTFFMEQFSNLLKTLVKLPDNIDPSDLLSSDEGEFVYKNFIQRVNTIVDNIEDTQKEDERPFAGLSNFVSNSVTKAVESTITEIIQCIRQRLSSLDETEMRKQLREFIYSKLHNVGLIK